MEKQFVVPVATFIAALLIWILFFVLQLTSGWALGLAPWFEVVACAAVGGLVMFSAVSCQKAGGPRVGGFVRAGLLLLFALLTYWKVGILGAGVLLAAGLAIGVGTLRAPAPPEASEDSPA